MLVCQARMVYICPPAIPTEIKVDKLAIATTLIYGNSALLPMLTLILQAVTPQSKIPHMTPIPWVKLEHPPAVKPSHPSHKPRPLAKLKPSQNPQVGKRKPGSTAPAPLPSLA
jgi:hypothetical protein